MATGPVTEQVAERIEDVAVATRQLDTRAVGFFGGGLSIGFAIGFYFGYRFNREKLKAEAFKQSEEEVEKIRDLYRQKIVVAEPKPNVEDIVKEKGYSPPTPPPKSPFPERPTRPPVPAREPAIEVVNPQTGEKYRQYKRHEARTKEKDDGWNFIEEIAKRTGDHPYIIHQDEFHKSDTGFMQKTLTFYGHDEVLTDEDAQTKIEDPNAYVGVENLTRFGHGADDFYVLYVRNPLLEIEYEICYLPRSYEEDVLGLTDDDEDD